MPSLRSSPTDTLGAPKRVLAGHGGDQLPNLMTQSGPAQVAAGAPPPVETPASAVPAEDGFRLDQDEMAPPIGVEAADQQPEEPISCLKVGPRTRTERDLELVAQEQVLDQKVVLPAEESCQRGEEDAHSLSILAGSPMRSDGVLPSYSRSLEGRPFCAWLIACSANIAADEPRKTS